MLFHKCHQVVEPLLNCLVADTNFAKNQIIIWVLRETKGSSSSSPCLPASSKWDSKWLVNHNLVDQHNDHDPIVLNCQKWMRCDTLSPWATTETEVMGCNLRRCLVLLFVVTEVRAAC
jgi:hypothetical protein